MPRDRPSFESTLLELRDVPGWLHDSQAMRLWDAARSIPEGGQIVEIGSYRGRATIVLARAAAQSVAVISIDPHAGDSGVPGWVPKRFHRAIRVSRVPGEWKGSTEGQHDHLAFHQHLRRSGLVGRVRQVRRPSASAHPDVAGEIDLLYVDGSHRYGDAFRDLRNWGARVREGGTMFVHDTYTSLFVTAAAYRTLAWSPRWRYVGRERSLAEYRRERVRGAVRALDLARQLSALPWFARNLVVRALVAARLERLAVVLGHRPGERII